jgi:outer membrane protein TolC
MTRPIAHKPRRVPLSPAAAGRAGLLALALLAGDCAVRPEPLGLAAIQARVDADLASMFQGQEPLAGPLGLHEAMARAIRYNLEGRLKTMETALSQRQLDLDRFDMLPRIAAEAGYEGRSNVNASSSESIETGTQSLEPSTSQEEDRFVGDLTVVWNVLDFGVSYVAAKQQANRLLIAEERHRKVVHNILQDVRAAYWRAVAAERLLGRIDQLMARVERARGDNATLERLRLGDPIRALSYGRALLEATRQLEAQRRELLLAKTELATLANLPPSIDFQLATLPEAEPARIALETGVM